MESMRDIDRAMEREIAKGSCPLRFVKIEFGDSSYQEIASREKLLEVLSYLLRTGDYGRFAGKGTGNNVYMDIKGRKPAFQRTRSFLDRNSIFSAIRRYGKKIKPDFDGHTYLETVRCIFGFSLILSTVSVTRSAQRFTMLAMVPVEIGILNTPDRISWVRLMLTAPTVFKATASAWRFSPYCTVAFISDGNAPLRVSPCSIQTGISKD